MFASRHLPRARVLLALLTVLIAAAVIGWLLGARDRPPPLHPLRLGRQTVHVGQLQSAAPVPGLSPGR